MLVAGGGPAALEAALALRARASRTATVRLLAPEPTWRYRPLSVVEPFAAGQAREYPLERLAAIGISVIPDALAEVDAASRTIRTGSGDRLSYDALIVATGASSQRSTPHAITFAGSGDADAMHGLLQDMEGGWCERIAFVAPAGAAWTLPLYELALQTAERARDLCLHRVAVTVVTHEGRPLEVFGPRAADAVASLLRDAGVTVVTGPAPSVPRAGRVETGAGEAAITADRVVALAVPVSRPVSGLPADAGGFLPVDRAGRVPGAPGVYAAGDGTSNPIKQGGLATQQADAAVSALLADTGLAPAHAPRCPVLRGMLLAGTRTLYLRREGTPEHAGDASPNPLWWPPTKIAGRYLGPFLDEIDAEVPNTRFERRRAAGQGAVRRRAILARVDRDGGEARVTVMEHRP